MRAFLILLGILTSLSALAADLHFASSTVVAGVGSAFPAGGYRTSEFHNGPLLAGEQRPIVKLGCAVAACRKCAADPSNHGAGGEMQVCRQSGKTGQYSQENQECSHILLTPVIGSLFRLLSSSTGRGLVLHGRQGFIDSWRPGRGQTGDLGSVGMPRLSEPCRP